MNIKLVKIESTNNALRTKEVEGTTNELPKVGQRFELMGEPINNRYSMRHVSTSPVQSVGKKKEGKILFKTLNSTYELELL